SCASARGWCARAVGCWWRPRPGWPAAAPSATWSPRSSCTPAWSISSSACPTVRSSPAAPSDDFQPRPVACACSCSCWCSLLLVLLIINVLVLLLVNVLVLLLVNVLVLHAHHTTLSRLTR